MKALSVAIVAISLGPSGATAAPLNAACDLPNVRYQGELNSVLSRRAVEVLNRAAKIEGERDPTLQQLVAPTADFSLGSGDVGRPLGKGVSGARALAALMKADTFRYLGWNYIPTPVETPCASHKVAVEFTDTTGKNVYPVTFTFSGGRVVAAEGWSRTFDAGPLEPVTR